MLLYAAFSFMFTCPVGAYPYREFACAVKQPEAGQAS